MQFQLPIKIAAPPVRIQYPDKIFMIGSCFTEHIGSALQKLKFPTCQNPNGILFDPESICRSMLSSIKNEPVSESDLVYLNEIWNSWQHHSRFSDLDKNSCLNKINQSRQEAHFFLKNADWVIITLGSSYYYRLTEKADCASLKPGSGVANCHRAPADWFDKTMMDTEEISGLLRHCLEQLSEFNASAKIIFTISPVRHARDGVVENNRSKARLIEAVHQLVNQSGSAFYFPAYELVIDVLRDYRFYDTDLVHPNYAATDFVMKSFKEYFIDPSANEIMEELEQLNIARHHKAFQPQTNAHKEFLKKHARICQDLMKKYPFLDLHEELNYFSVD